MSSDHDTGISDWPTANQRALTAELAGLRELLEQHAKGETPATEPSLAAASLESTERGEQGAENETEQPGSPDVPDAEVVPPGPAFSSALDQLCATFRLTSFERALLLFCAGVELDSRFAPLCAELQGDALRTNPTFGMALSVLPDAHWSALSPTRPLRWWRLLEVGAGASLTASQLRIDERALHFLAGVDCVDERLFGLLRSVADPVDLPESQFKLAERLSQVWQQSETALVQLHGDDPAAAQSIVVAASALLQTQVLVLQATDVPASAAEREAFIRLWEREASFSNGVLLVECDESLGSEPAPALAEFLETTQSRIVVSGREVLRLRHRPLRRFKVSKPNSLEQSALWRAALGDAGERLNGHIESAAAQFNLGSQAISAASREVFEELQVDTGQELGNVFWEACRTQSRLRLNDLAQRIEPRAGWDDLVLPLPQLEGLRQIAVHVRQRARVYEDWGFADKCARGLGISALFSGASGTGKTMAAEVLANELKLDLYRIDLSAMVSKYIGETEKNLRRVFDAAEAGGAILLFDEADALFGKRSEVKDSHDRYANIEVSYLLQRMEAYRGLAILTTNMKSALDKAFMRRLRFVVQFPFPDAAQRAEIWRRVFPTQTPTEDLDATKLARLNIAGGNIRNIALNASFLAADVEERVRMNHLLAAARSEYAKLEKSLNDAEIGGWV